MALPSFLMALNGVLGLAYAFMMPCYAAFIYVDDGDNVFARVGELVQRVWYPGSLVLRVGDSGRRRYAPNTHEEVLKNACFPCPTVYASQSNPLVKVTSERDFLNKITTTYGSEYQEDPYALAPVSGTRKDCVRVGTVGLPSALTFVRGPRTMSAKEYVAYQLFGSDWATTYKALYGTDPIAKTTALGQNLRAVDLAKKLNGKWNRELFGNFCPFPTARVTEWIMPEGEPKYTRAVLNGYFLWNGKPLIVPKLWHTRGDSSASALKNPWNLYTQVTSAPERENIDQMLYGMPSYSRSVHYTVYGVTTPRGTQVQQIEGIMHAFDKNAKCNTASQELEWWYPYDPASGENICTTFCNWTEAQAQHYVANFMAGGGAPTCTFVSLVA